MSSLFRNTDIILSSYPGYRYILTIPTNYRFKISTVACTSESEGSEVTVVVAALEEPVIFSPAVKFPLGTVTVRVVPEGLVIIDAVTPLVAPVIVSPTLKLPEAPTVMVMVPKG